MDNFFKKINEKLLLASIHGFLLPNGLGSGISLNSISIAYFIGLKNQMDYQPYFLFKGILTYQTGETIQAEVILPAAQ